MPDRDVLLPIHEAATYADMTVGTLRRRAYAGELPTYRDGKDRRRLLIRVSDLDALREPQAVDRRVAIPAGAS